LKLQVYSLIDFKAKCVYITIMKNSRCFSFILISSKKKAIKRKTLEGKP
jgi:hypothetical protein